MATREEIIIDIRVTEVADELAKTTAQIQNLKKENKGLDKTTRDGAKAFAENTAKIKDLTVQEKVLSNQIAVVAKNTHTLGDSFLEQARDLDKLKGQYYSLTTEMKNTQGGRAMKATIDELDKSVKANAASLGDHFREVGNYEKASIPLKKELREIKEEMQKMHAAGLENTKDFQELSLRAGKLRDSMDAVNDQVKTLAVGSRLEAGLNTMKGGIDGVVGSAQIAQGVMQTFGSENENVARGIQKLVALQSISQGTQTLFNSLKKEGALVTSLYAAKTKIASAAQYIYTAAVGSSTGALKIFKVALLATGIGAAIALVAALVSNWDELTSVFSRSGRELKKLNAEMDAYKKSGNDLENINNRTVEIMEAKGAKQSEIMRAEAKGLTELFSERQKELNLINKKIDLGKASEDDLKRRDELTEQLGEITHKVDVLNIKGKQAIKKEEEELTKKIQEENKKRIDSEKEKRENSLKISQELEDSIIRITKEGVEKEIAEKRKATDRKISELKKETKLTEQGIKDRDLLITSLNEEFEKEASAMREKASAETLKAEAEKELKRLNILIDGATEGTEKEYNLRLKALQKQSDMELAEVGLAEEEKEAIRAKYRNLEVDLENDKVKEKLEISKKALKDDFELRKAKVLEDDVELANVEIMQLEAQHAALLSLDEKQKQALGLNQKQYEALVLTSEAAIRAAKAATVEKENQTSVQQIQSFARISDSFSSILNTMASDQEEMQDYLGAIALANIATSTASAIAGVVAAASKSSNVWQIIAEIAAGIASVTATIITAKNSLSEGKTPKAPRFEDGGIVPGTSYTGDNVPALVNSGEMILNQQQQANLFKSLDNTPMSSGFDYNQLAKAMENVRPQVAVTEIKNVNSRVDVIENLKYI